MSKSDAESPERLRSAGASQLERRLLNAAAAEQPSRELSERMARGLGIALPGVAGLASATGAKAATTAPVTGVFRSLLPWLSGGLAAAFVAGAFVATRPSATPASGAPMPALVSSAPLARAVVAPVAPPSAATFVTGRPTEAGVEEPAKGAVPPPSTRMRGDTLASELANEIAMVDAARAALAGGDATRALAGVRSYQAAYPSGTFRPEVAAINIEALLKLGRQSDARALAKRFPASYGPGPLADRVSRLVNAAQP